ncbi:hypothetical protein Prudu_012500 [Prunus dulcis]|uniref:S-adenosyl-L-methionine-dependent methyltransferases superfamily protein n=1 Tax=Prunus dulcis TaxID=3755 RepID=A0A4Y1RCU8_PRUDU|nr:hypothetical protein Prudu_012500 [Prunus dulcis]
MSLTMASNGFQVAVSHMKVESSAGCREEGNKSQFQGDNVVVSSIKLEKIFSMKGGKGESSYANNSQAQAIHARSMLHLLKETLDNVQLSSPQVPFVVVDLGCSSGSNTIYIIDVIIKHIAKRYEALGCEPPEFSAFFSDLPSNDFNTLFQLLPPMANHGGSMEETLAADSHRSYFAAGVPGSFYRRLFPSRSIDLFHSAFSLHWLSQVPESVLDKRSAAYNKERVFIHGANESTAIAYKKQFQTDLASFLRSRAKELKKGGSMFLVCLGRTSVDPLTKVAQAFSLEPTFRMLGMILSKRLIEISHIFELQLADQKAEKKIKEMCMIKGLITNEKRDSFNIPVYASSLQDFKEVVEDVGRKPLVVNQPDDAAEVGRALANSCRSVAGVLVDAHIGDHLGNELFARVEQRGTGQSKELLEQLQFLHIVASLSLAGKRIQHRKEREEKNY